MLNSQQKKAAFEIKGNTLLSASPGSGKTRTLIARAEYKLDSLPNKKNLALITYTNAAADEIAARVVSQYPIFIGTIHRFCLEFILRPFSWIYGWAKPRVVSYDELQDFIQNNQDLDLGNSPLDQLNSIKRNLDGNLDNVEWNSNVPLIQVAKQYFNYLSSINSLDFNEILFRSYKIVSENQFVANSLSNKFYEILIDEFQDTNVFQYHIFRLIYASGPVTIFMVGDERQRIYRFAGAIDDAFCLARNDFLAQHELLTETYRSTNNIVEAYCSLFIDHPVVINKSEYKDIEIPVCFQETNKDNHDYYLHNYVTKLREEIGISQSEIVVLSARWTDALQASRTLRKDFNVVGLGALPHSTRNLNNSTFNLLRCLSRFYYRPAIKNLRSIKRGIELHILENNLHFTEQELVIIQNKLVYEFENLSKDELLHKGLEKVSEFFFKIFGIDHPTFNDIIDRINTEEILFWDTEKYFKTLSGIDGVTINTIHQAKGLEYDAVILDQMNVGRIPFQAWDRVDREFLDATQKNIEDGKNLFYVALSRAKKKLIILHNWKPSMFIELIK